MNTPACAASGGDVSLLGAQATSSFLPWASAASACGDTYEWHPSWVVPVTGVPALVAAMLDANYI